MGSFNLNNSEAGIDASKIFLFNFVSSLNETKEFSIENIQQNRCCSRGGGGRKKTACKLTNAILTEFTWCELLDST